jgi:hypothetical protein
MGGGVGLLWAMCATSTVIVYSRCRRFLQAGSMTGGRSAEIPESQPECPRQFGPW